MNQLPKTRHSLVLRLADAGDGRAWNEFVEVYERSIFRYACSRGLQPADADDVTQRVLEAVLAKSRKWNSESDGSFTAWLFRVTRNLAAKKWNEQARGAINVSHADDTAGLEAIASPSDEEKTVFQLEYRKALFHWAAERVRDQFRADTWTMFWMNTVEQKESTQIAREMGIDRSAIYVAKCRVLARIRAEIERFEEEFSDHDETISK